MSDTPQDEAKPVKMAKFRETSEVPQGGFSGPHAPPIVSTRIIELPEGSDEGNPALEKVDSLLPLSDWEIVQTAAPSGGANK